MILLMINAFFFLLNVPRWNSPSSFLSSHWFLALTGTGVNPFVPG